MDKIINENKGTFRKIIPKETGGSITNNDVLVPEPIKNNNILVPTITEPINPYIKYPEQEQQQQSGGKLRKPVKTKKYNFRLV